MLAGEDTSGRFVTTIHAVNSGILKLSLMTPVMTVFRGASGLGLPEQLEAPPKFAGRMGIEARGPLQTLAFVRFMGSYCSYSKNRIQWPCLHATILSQSKS